MLNKIIIVGNLTADVEVRYTPQGKAVANLRIASKKVWKNHSGDKKEDTCFITCVVWGKHAENCAEHLKKGSPVFIEGRLQTRSWEKDGKKQYATEILVEGVQYMDRTEEQTREEEPDPFPES